MGTSTDLFRVVQAEARYGDPEYDDQGGYIRSGWNERTWPQLYTLRTDAEAAAAVLNAGCATWNDADSGGPFWEPDGFDFEYADRVLIAWPMFQDWLAENGIPTLADVDELGFVLSDTEPPQRYELETWFMHVVESSGANGWWDGEGWDAADGELGRRIHLLKTVLRGPALFDVEQVPAVHAAEILAVAAPDQKATLIRLGRYARAVDALAAWAGFNDLPLYLRDLVAEARQPEDSPHAEGDGPRP